MASHHTKDKGDLGLVKVICDMAENGIGVYLPMSEHQPSDLIAVDESGRTARVQVKYRKVNSNGVICLHFRSAYSDGNGYHEKPVDRSQFDCYAVYCPDNRKIYYVRNDDVPEANTKGISLRVVSPRNHQKKKICLASRFEAAERIFD